MKIVDGILAAIDSGSMVALVGFDISAAFDSVCHQTLLHRLDQEFGITGVAWNGLHRTFQRDRSPSTLVVLRLLPFSSDPASLGDPSWAQSCSQPISRRSADLSKGHGINFHKYADDTQLYVAL